MSNESLTARDMLWLAELARAGGTRAHLVVVRECRRSCGVVAGYTTALQHLAASVHCRETTVRGPLCLHRVRSIDRARPLVHVATEHYDSFISERI